MHYAPELTGNAPYTTTLSQELARRGQPVQVLASHPHYPEWEIADGYGDWRRDEIVSGVRLRRLLHWVPSTPSTLQRLLSEMSFGLRQTFQRWGSPATILLISPALFASAIAMLKARVTSARRVAWVQDIYSAGLQETQTGGRLANKVVRLVESWFLRSAHEVVVIHESFRRVLVDELGVPAERVTVIRNWSHIEPPTPRDRAKVRASMGWSDSEFVALHAGNQGLKQGLENLVEVARLADDRDEAVTVVLLGDGNQHERLRSLGAGIDRLQFASSVSHDDFPSVLHAADALIVNELPGVAEMSVPSKLTSYFAAGRPVVGACSASGGAGSEIQSSGAGVRVDPGDPAELLDALKDLRSEPRRGEELARRGLAYRAQTLGIDSAVTAFYETLFPPDDRN